MGAAQFWRRSPIFFLFSENTKTRRKKKNIKLANANENCIESHTIGTFFVYVDCSTEIRLQLDFRIQFTRCQNRILNGHQSFLIQFD